MIDRRMMKNQGKRLLMGFWKLLAGIALVLFLLTHQARSPQQAETPAPQVEPGADEQE